MSDRKDVLYKIENTVKDSMLFRLLGKDGVEELRSKLIDAIVEEVRDQLHDSSYYIISPEDVVGTMRQDIIEEAVAIVKKRISG